MLQVWRLCAASTVGLVVAVRRKKGEEKRDTKRGLYSYTNSREWVHDPWSVLGIRQVLPAPGQSAVSSLYKVTSNVRVSMTTVNVLW